MSRITEAKLNFRRLDPMTLKLSYEWKNKAGERKTIESVMFDGENDPKFLAKTLRDFAAYIRKHAK